MTVGLTGGIGAGKSVVSKILIAMGYPVFNSDLEAKLLVENNSEIKSKIIALLGEETYKNSTYNRAYVASIVFQNNEKLAQLNAIIHPAVRRAFQDFCVKTKSNLVFNEAAILFETGAYKNFDKTILICADEKVRLARVKDRDQTSAKEIKARFDKQWSDEQKRPFADFILENNGTESVLLQLNDILENLK